MEGFEAQHWGGDPLDKAVVLFKDVVQIFYLDNHDGATIAGELEDDVYRPQARQISPAFVNDDSVRHTIRAHCSLEEPPGGSQITPLGQHEIKGFAVPMNGAIEVGPSDFDLDVVSSVRQEMAAGCFFAWASALEINQWELSTNYLAQPVDKAPIFTSPLEAETLRQNRLSSILAISGWKVSTRAFRRASAAFGQAGARSGKGKLVILVLLQNA